MKRLLAILLLVLALGIVSGCISGPRTERSARMEQRRDRSTNSGLQGLPEDLETFWLNDDPQHLNRWQH